MSHDSDWFGGTCDCSDVPCKWSVAEQRRLLAADAMRGRITSAYQKHHKQWPLGAYTDSVLGALDIRELALCEQGRVIVRPNVLYRFTVHRDCHSCYLLSTVYANE